MRKSNPFLALSSSALLLSAFAVSPSAIAGGASFAFAEGSVGPSDAHEAQLTAQLQQSTRRALEARGYRYDAAQPELLVDLDLAVQRVVRTTPMASAGAASGPRGHGGYRHSNLNLRGDGMRADGGISSGPRLGRTQYDLREHHQSVLSISLLDSAQRDVVWEGSTVQRIYSDRVDITPASIDAAVADVLLDHRAVASR